MGLNRIEPLMLNNKLSIVRINNLMDSVAGNVHSPASSYTALTSDGVILMTSGTATLFDATGNTSNGVFVKNVGASSVKLEPSAGTIDGASAITMASQYDAVAVISDGASWHITSRYVTA